MIHLIRCAPHGYPHAGAFAELEECLYWGFRELRQDVQQHTVTLWSQSLPQLEGKRIFLGAHLLDDAQLAELNPHDVVYNTEQVLPESPWMRQTYLEALSRVMVWDFSVENAERWQRLGITARHVPPGYVGRLERITLSPAPQIDVLFYGSPSPRRRKVIEQCRDRGLKVLEVFGRYGAERDELIADSKLVLNIHFRDDSVLETVRLAYLINNAVPTLSESTAGQVAAEWFCWINWCSYDRLADACKTAVDNWELTRLIAARRREEFKVQCAQRKYLRRYSGLLTAPVRHFAGNSEGI